MNKNQKNAKRRAAAFEKRQSSAKLKLTDELQAIYDQTQILESEGKKEEAFALSLTHASKCQGIAKLGREQRIEAQEFHRKERARAREEAKAAETPTEAAIA